jgi:hypothetical protein
MKKCYIITLRVSTEASKFPKTAPEVLAGRADSMFSQLVRNLKSHKTTKTNFIYQGYAESIPNGFRITERGRDFVKEYFSGV